MELTTLFFFPPKIEQERTDIFKQHKYCTFWSKSLTEKNKVQTFAGTLERQLPLNEDDNDDWDENIEKEVIRLRSTSGKLQCFQHTIQDEVREVTRVVKLKKAPEQDNFSDRMLEWFTSQGVITFTSVIKTMLKLRFLMKWRDKFFSKNYLSISLLPEMNRIAEKIVERMLEEHTEEVNIIPDEQFGFSR